MWARYWTLPAARRRILAEALVGLGIAALVVAVVPFRRIAAFLGRPRRSVVADVDRDVAIAETRWAIEACARRVPWRAKCFEQGLAAQWMLRRRGIPATLHYGIAQQEGVGLSAHVWVCAETIEVVGCEIKSSFVELAHFPSVQA